LWSKYPDILKELNVVEEYIKKSIQSRNKLVSQVVNDLVGAGGKRLRPALAIICSGFGKGSNEKVTSIAGALEILHSATLVHDDIIDRTRLRRGKPTVAEKYGVDMAVYTGDYLFTKAVLMLSKDIPVDKLKVVAKSVTTICEGEVYQYQDRYNINTTVLSYLKRIRSKTAVLFGAACGLGAYGAECPEDISTRLSKFGVYYGMAFQIRDDLNDILSDSQKSGKPVLNDISEGTITLPVIYALKRSWELRDMVAKFAVKRTFLSPREAEEMARLVKDCGGVKDAGVLLEKYIDKGLNVISSLPDISNRQMLKDLISELRI
jgi:heptaprenyl diphosphate synthase